jgi:hypothetical protein
MRLTWKDGLATGLAGAVVALYVAFRAGADLPLVSGPRALAGAVLLLGFAGCALGGSGVSPAGKGSATVVRYTISSVLGVIALVAGLWALFTGNGVALAVLVVATVAIWAVATTYHLIAGTGDRQPVGHRG